MKKLLTTVLSLLFVISLFSQNSQNGIWRSAKEVAFAKKNAERRIVPDKYKTFSLDLSALSEILKEAPLRFTEGAKSKAPTLPVPLPTGLFQDFEIMEAPVMHPGLAAKYPGMKSYAGWSKEDPTAYFRFGVTQKGFHGIILSARHSTVYIDAYAVGDTEHYVCYFKKDYSKKQDFECLVDAPPFPKNIVQPADKNLAGDCMHRTFELALACTGEYAQFHGGTVASVMAEYNVAITRVNSIYERDANLTLELIANTDQLIFLNAATDPYTNNNGSTMLGQNQTTVGNIIGNANYDIGHVFSTGGGGIAQLNSVCSNNRKAMGVTGLTNPVGDPFYVDYVCHEMGHQFGGNHTQNNPCNRNNATAMEPGSANTIMGYAGICAPNSQNFSDDHFHAVSLAEIAAHVTGSGGSCADLSPNGNNAPSVAVPATSYNLPISTPFALTAEGTDPDGDNMLTYCWEQMDNQVANMPPETTNTGGPAFRSFPPVESPTRYFPRLSAIVNNSSPTWEVLPSVSRMMNFRCTVRDNNPGGGCTDEADVDLQFSNNAGPFLVSAPNTAAVVWTTAGMEDVNWDVANTDAAPINAANVDIYLSIDGGLTYPFLLSENTPNDGSEQVLVPIQETTQARVMVKANGNIFFDISNENFSIEMPAVPTFVLSPNPALQMACQSGEADFGFDLQALSGFNEMITFTATDVPAGATVSFDANPSAPSGTVTMTVDGLENLSPGTYTIQVEGTSTTISQNTQVELVILDLVSGTPTNTDPLDGSSGVAPTGGVLTWAQVPFATGYYVELSDSPGFQTLLSQDTVTENSFDLPVLMETQVYYWRIRGFNMCSEGPLSEFFAFQTGAPACVEYASENVPVPISPNQAVTVTSTIEVPVNKAVSSIALSMDASHSWVGDLLATLTSPGGTEVLLFDQPGVPAEQYGCGNDNMEVSFSDSAANTADDLENTCNPSPLAIDGDFQAIEPLSNFIGENGLGTWTLSISDLVAQDGGSLDGWTLEVCSAESFEPAVLINNNVFTVPQGMSGTITNSFLEAEGMGSTGKFTLLSEPQNGTLYLQGAALQLGSSFTQTDIDMGNLSYTHDGSMVLTDSFLFDVTDEQSKWLHGQVFQIQIIENSLAASVVLSQNIDCNNANNGIITATPTGGNAPFEYSLNGGAFQSSNVFENLAAGTYTVTVMDNTGFTANTNTVEITNPSPIVLSADVVADVITANANGGTGTLQYSIDGIVFQNSNVFPGLSNNSYTVTVMDENGCLETVNAIVAVNTMIVSATVSEGISCFGESDGTVTVNAGGGMEPYAYSLNGGAFQADNVFSNLGEGT
ncbi:MAG TPA: hypothetical protein ENJ95_21235, partial [Bacteroidetes bacterium]|nr:hypothetical protein [Bacteroidota bacterium]